MNSCVFEFTLARTDDALAPAQGINQSREFELSQCELQFSTVRLDSAMEAGFASLMLSGRVLTINLNTIMSQQAIIPAGAVEFQASVTRALTRITACLRLFRAEPTRSNRRCAFTIRRTAPRTTNAFSNGPCKLGPSSGQRCRRASRSQPR